ncbi:MAG: LppU/SCO3897 family protein [Arachnia sp.]
MSQPPTNSGNDPQWNPNNAGGASSQQPPVPGQGPYDQSHSGPVGPDGQPWTGPVGPNGQPLPGATQPHGGTKFNVKQILTGVLVVVFLGVTAFFVWQNIQKDAALAVGNCLVFTGTPTDADHELVDCDDSSVYSEYVGEVIDGDGQCSDPQSASYTISESDRSGDTTDVTKITCLVPQLFEGQCYASLPEGSVNDLEVVDCANQEFEVTSVVDGIDAECAEGSEAIAFAVPERTYCIAFQG